MKSLILALLLLCTACNTTGYKTVKPVSIDTTRGNIVNKNNAHEQHNIQDQSKKNFDIDPRRLELLIIVCLQSVMILILTTILSRKDSKNSKRI